MYSIPVDTGRKLNVIRRSEDVQDVLWTSYVRPIYVLCLRGFLFVKLTSTNEQGYLRPISGMKVAICYCSFNLSM